MHVLFLFCFYPEIHVCSSLILELQEKCTNSWHLLKCFLFFLASPACNSIILDQYCHPVLCSPVSDSPVKRLFHYAVRLWSISYYFLLLCISIFIMLPCCSFLSLPWFIFHSRSHCIFSDRWTFTITLFQALFKKFLISQCLQMNCLDFHSRQFVEHCCG